MTTPRHPLINVIARVIGVVVALTCGEAIADIAIIVHPQNPLASLSEDDVRRIFMGRTRLFPGSGIGITAADLTDTNPFFSDFYQALAHLTPDKLKRQRASYLFSGNGRLPQVLENENAMLEFVANTTSAIGYLPVEQIDNRVKTICVVKQ